MGTKAGLHAGQWHGQTVKADGKFVPESIWIPANQFQITYISGTAATASSISGQDYTYNFLATADVTAGFSFVVPTNVKAGTDAKATVYWTSTAGHDGTTAEDTDAVLDIDYFPFSTYVSGASINDRDYVLSGVGGAGGVIGYNATVTGTFGMLSGALSIDSMRLPGSSFVPGDYVRCIFFRDATETADNLGPASAVIGILIEFMDEEA